MLYYLLLQLQYALIQKAIVVLVFAPSERYSCQHHSTSLPTPSLPTATPPPPQSVTPPRSSSRCEAWLKATTSNVAKSALNTCELHARYAV